MKCLQCGSEDVISGVRVVDRGDNNLIDDLKLEVYQNSELGYLRGQNNIN
jgi:hypothetical protein